ncbi:AMPK1-CBM domain-containing protein [Fusarium keratoplasticum]|uniref:AMPK1-CBM domain-containing protein n=1 Tax=Fusarium keratoplasticum TaxID=1328300 RepID=A0ACC0QWA7_9HYPO|nr:AMPK1-CBM domain-containing protein [Fusarium keratoplasticum]KAI8669029.1 AMPK1-CBM domain-containing protein [Fusarium keratoplasticum]
MGSFTFKWEHPADEVYVTGTFDDWTKSVKLEKTDDVFSKTVDLKDASSKIYYKFVVDGNWVINQSAPNEPDTQGNVNNFLTPDQISQDTAAAAILNTVTPTSTTAAMASEQPIEVKPVEEKALNEKVLDEKLAEDKAVAALTSEETLTENEKAHPLETPSDIPGGFPVTPATELDKPVTVAPLANELEKPISVNPLPASEGVGNPITLAPGEKIPESITAQSTDKYVKLDKESYEKSDAIPGVETELPPVSANTIPESSLPIIGAQDVAINTVTPVSTTAALAAEVPLEPKPAVPEVVKESQEKANAAPEASAEAEGVEEKAKVEEELKEKVPEAPATSEGTAGQGTEKSEKAQDAGLAALAATAGGAVIAAGLTAKETIEEKAAPVVNNATEVITDAANKNLPDAVKEKLPVAAQEALDAKNKEQVREEVSPEVPAEVKESLVEAGKSPEAAANTEAVQEKKEVEAELLKEVKPVTGTYDAVVEPTSEETKQVSPEVPAEVKESIVEAGKSPEAAANTEAVEEKKLVEAELLKEVAPVAPVEETKTEAVAPEVPAEVKESIVEAGKAPEAAASTEAVENKKEVEAELLKETEPVPAVKEAKVEEAEPAAEPAAAVAPVVQPEEAKPEAKTETPKVEETKTEEAKPAEPAVEPVTKPEEVKAEAKPEPQAETPAVGNGTSAAENGSKATETKPAEPAANGSSSTTAQKKKHNRLSSIFSKIKHKLSDHK